MVVIEIVILFLALLFAPPMVYKAVTGRELWPVLVSAWDATAPYLEVAAWATGKVFAPRVPRNPPRLFSAVPEDDDLDSDVDEAPAAPVAALPPGDRAAVVRALVRDDWTVGQIRALLKGDNGMIGQEIEQARAVLGNAPPRRVVTIHHGRSGEVEL
jgi:hypothetical protein